MELSAKELYGFSKVSWIILDHFSESPPLLASDETRVVTRLLHSNVARLINNDVAQLNDVTEL